MERYHITHQYLKLDTAVAVAAQFESGSDACLTPENVFPALVFAIRTLPALSAHIHNERGSSPGFVRMQSIDVEGAVRFLGKDKDETMTAMDAKSEDVAALLEDAFTSIIDASECAAAGLPLWRVTVASANILVFSWHHAIGDGQSGLAVLRAILDGLNSVDSIPTGTTTDYHAVRPPASTSLSPPLEALTDVTPSLATLFPLLLGLIVPRKWSQRRTWSGNAVPRRTSADAVKTHVRLIAIPAPPAARLIASARAHGATLTSALYVLVLATLSPLVAALPGKRRYTRLRTNVPVSLRHITETPANVMCEEISIHVSSEALLLSGFSWEKAAPYSKELHRAVPRTREIVGAMKFLFGDYEGYFKGMLGKKREGSFVLSNLGAFKTDATETMTSASQGSQAWSIGNVYFAQDDSIIGYAIKINVVGGTNGSVHISITWGEGALDARIVESFVREFSKGVEDLTREEHVAAGGS